MLQHTVTLAGETDSIGFRKEARALLAALVAPDAVEWHTGPQSAGELRAKTGLRPPRRSSAQGATHLLLPRSVITLCETVILHNAPQRFALLYRLLWRLMHEPDLAQNPLDDDRLRVLHMAQAVRRDIQKMKTFLHFRPLSEEARDGAAVETLQLAWFEPDHHVLEAVAPHFARRLAPLRWAILTPGRSVRWQQELLEFGPGLPAHDRPGDAAPDAQWLAGYRQVFGAPSHASSALRSEQASSAPSH
jgi:uracil-DNA glycosylase